MRLLLALALLLAPAIASAQQNARAAAKEGIDAYGEGEYELALSRLRLAEGSGDYGLLSPQEKVLLQKYIGYCEVAFGRREAALAAFRVALAIEPGLELDGAKVSPKIVEVFREAKRESSAAISWEANPTPTPVVTPPPPPKPRLDPAIFVPGLAQVKRGDTGKGIAYAGGAVAAIGLAGYLQYTSLVAESYVDDAGPRERSEMKRQVSRVHLMRSASLVPIVAIWGASIVDGSRKPKASVVVRVDRDAAHVAVGWTF